MCDLPNAVKKMYDLPTSTVSLTAPLFTASSIAEFFNFSKAFSAAFGTFGSMADIISILPLTWHKALPIALATSAFWGLIVSLDPASLASGLTRTEPPPTKITGIASDDV